MKNIINYAARSILLYVFLASYSYGQPEHIIGVNYALSDNILGVNYHLVRPNNVGLFGSLKKGNSFISDWELININWDYVEPPPRYERERENVFIITGGLTFGVNPTLSVFMGAGYHTYQRELLEKGEGISRHYKIVLKDPRKTTPTAIGGLLYKPGFTIPFFPSILLVEYITEPKIISFGVGYSLGK